MIVISLLFSHPKDCHPTLWDFFFGFTKAGVSVAAVFDLDGKEEGTIGTLSSFGTVRTSGFIPSRIILRR